MKEAVKKPNSCIFSNNKHYGIAAYVEYSPCSTNSKSEFIRVN